MPRDDQIDPLMKRSGTGPASKVIREEELMRMLLMGFTVKEAAIQIHKGYSTCCHVARKPEFLLKLREHSGEIAKRLIDELATSQIEMAQKLELASAAALDEMINMMEGLDGASKLKVQICQDLLDRDPKSSRTKRMELGGTLSHDFISPAVLIHAAATAKEIQDYQTKKGDLPNGDGNPPNHANGG